MGELIPLFPLGTPLFPGVVLPLQIFEPRYRRLMADLMALPDSEDRRFFGVVAIRQGWEVEQVAPAEALYDIGCTARLRAVRPQPDGGFRIVTVGGDRFRLLDVVVGDDPPYLQAEVEWLDDEEAAEEAAGNSDGLAPDPGARHLGATHLSDTHLSDGHLSDGHLSEIAAPDGADLHGPDSLAEVVASTAQGSMNVLARGVRELFTRYVSEVADLNYGRGRSGRSESGLGEAVDAETAVLVGAVADDPTALSYLVASVALLTTEDRQALLAESATRRRLAAESRLLRRELTMLTALGAVPASLHEFATPMTVN